MLLRFFVRVFKIDIFQQRCIEVVIMQLIYTKNSLSQFQIAMEGAKVLIDVIYQTMINLGGDVTGIECTFKTWIVFPCILREEVCLYLRIQECSVGSAILIQLAHECCKDFLAVLTICRGSLESKSCRIKLDGLPVAQRNFWIWEIGICEDAVDIIRFTRHQSGICNNLFFTFGARVRFAAKEVVQIMSIDFQLLLTFDESLYFRRIDLKNLGFDKCCLCTERCSKLTHFLLHSKVRLYLRILIKTHIGVCIEAGEFFIEFGDEIETSKQLLSGQS